MWKNRVAWAFLCLGALAAYVFENGLGTALLLSLCLGLPLVSGLVLALWPVKLRGELRVPELADRGEEAACRLILTGPRLLPIRCLVTAQNRFTGQTARICAAEVGETAFVLTPVHCGSYLVTVGPATVYDLLGIFKKNCLVEAAGTLLTPPQTVPLALELAQTGTGADSETYSALRPGADPSETFRIRDYVPGDSIRQIHWKLSEKTGKTLVRDFGLPLVNQTLLLLETTAIPGTSLEAEAMDLCLDLLASVTAALCAMGQTPVVLDTPIRDPTDLATLWPALLSQPLSEGVQTVCGRTAAEGLCTYAHVAVISPYPPPDGASLLNGNRVTVLLAGPGESPGVETVPISAKAFRSGELELVL